MQIRELKVTGFRGIATLYWKPAAPFCCLIGPGDSGKSTILDAVEAVLSARWFTFSEPDFLGCETSAPITIEATVGELSKALKSDERFGLYIRGWTSDNCLRDEPEDGDEAVLTVRLTVDATMQPSWELVCDRSPDPRVLSNRDRALFGLVRLAGDDARHLAWGQGSVLSRITGDNDETAGRLAEAYRSARSSANLHEIKALAEASGAAEGFAKRMGAYVSGSYGPGLELGRSGLSAGSIALHDDKVPLRLAGLGSRRLATLALQKAAVTEGAIVLVDEIELGLEPHRIMGAISQLKADQKAAATARKPLGQILLTTHSDTALAEAGPETTRVVKIKRPMSAVTVMEPATLEALQVLMRFNPKALFAKRILVCEGHTEVGLLLGLRDFWPERHDGRPIEYLGGAIADGNGSQACAMATSLADLGFETALYRDSDDPLSSEQKTELERARILVFEYGKKLCTEEAILLAASDELVQRVLDYARLMRGADFVDNNLAAHIPGLNLGLIRGDFSAWSLIGPEDEEQLRRSIARVASAKVNPAKKDKKTWFKDQRISRGLAPIIYEITTSDATTPLAITLNQVESWLYA